VYRGLSAKELRNARWGGIVAEYVYEDWQTNERKTTGANMKQEDE
jgi:hypothetical protein